MLPSKRIKVRHLSTNRPQILIGYFFLDSFQLCWAIVGVFLSNLLDTDHCANEFGYIALTSQILMGMSFIVVFRVLYLMTFFMLGDRVFAYFERRESNID